MQPNQILKRATKSPIWRSVTGLSLGENLQIRSLTGQSQHITTMNIWRILQPVISGQCNYVKEELASWCFEAQSITQDYFRAGNIEIHLLRISHKSHETAKFYKVHKINLHTNVPIWDSCNDDHDNGDDNRWATSIISKISTAGIWDTSEPQTWVFVDEVIGLHTSRLHYGLLAETEGIHIQSI